MEASQDTIEVSYVFHALCIETITIYNFTINLQYILYKSASIYMHFSASRYRMQEQHATTGAPIIEANCSWTLFIHLCTSKGDHTAGVFMNVNCIHSLGLTNHKLKYTQLCRPRRKHLSKHLHISPPLDSIAEVNSQ